MFKHQGMLRLLVKLGKNSTATKTVGIKYFDDPRLYMYSEENGVLMIQAAGAFIRNGHRLGYYHTIYSHKHVRALLDEIQAYALGQWEGNFGLLRCRLIPRFGKQINIPRDSFFIYKYNLSFRLRRKEKKKKWETMAEMREKHHLLKFEWHLSFLKDSPCNQELLSEYSVKNNAQKRLNEI